MHVQVMHWPATTIVIISGEDSEQLDGFARRRVDRAMIEYLCLTSEIRTSREVQLPFVVVRDHDSLT